MRDLVIDVNHPRGAQWPPADELIRLDDLQRKKGPGLFKALRTLCKHPRYGRVYISCKDLRHVKPELLLAALSLGDEVWFVPITSPVHRITKGGLFWKLPLLRRYPAIIASRVFAKNLTRNPPLGNPVRTGGVLILSHSYPPSTGGIQTSMVNAAEGFQRRGVPVRVLDSYRLGWRSYDGASPVPIRRVYNGRRYRIKEFKRLARRAAEATRLLPGRPPSGAVVELCKNFLASCSPEKAADFLSNYEAACRLMSKGSPDTIHVGYCHPDSMVAFLLSAIGGWPYMLYVHGTESLRFSKNERLSVFFDKSYSSAAAILANAHYAARIIEKGHRVTPDIIDIIHPGVDFERYSTAPTEDKFKRLRERYGLNENSRVIFIVGRVIPLKGFDTLLKALPTILTDFPETVLLIGGDGPYLPRIRRMVDELKLENSVRVLGRVPDDELVAHYHLADLFVMPSRDEPPGAFEGFGIVYLEAGAAGTPQIGGRSGGIPDAIHDKETGLLCDPRDPTDLAEKVILLWRDPALLKRLGEGARRWAEELDWERVVGRKLALDEKMRRRAATGEWAPPG